MVAVPDPEGELSDAPTQPPSMFDVIEDHQGRSVVWRRVPSLIRRCFALCNRADPSAFRAVVLVGVASGLANAVQVGVLGLFLQRLVQHGQNDPLAGQGIPVVAFVVVSGLSQLLFASMQERRDVLTEAINREVVGEILDAVAAAPLEAFESPEFFARLQRAQMSQHYPFAMVLGVTQLIPAAFQIIGFTVALGRIHPLLAPFALFALFPTLFAIDALNGARHRFFIGMSLLERKRSYLLGVLTSREPAKEVIAFGLAPFFRRRYGELTAELIAEKKTTAKRRIRLQRLIGLAQLGMSLLCFVVLFALYRHGRVGLGEAGAGFYALRAIGGAITATGVGIGQLHESSLFLDDYECFAALATEFHVDRPTGPAPESFDNLRADDVSFHYPGSARTALHNVSITVRRGEIVALVGENGSGKTTLAKLLAGLYTPTDGAVRWDGVDIATVDPDLLRRRVSVIFQDFLRYFLTAGENIGVGDVDRLHDRAAIQHAAEQAGAHAFVKRLPNGYDTSLERHLEGGSDLSVGQWQRIALARAFFRAAPFVILDEPTSALDARAEHDLFEHIRTLLAGRSVLLISHRFSTVRTADRIVVLHQGRIVEEGTHAALMKASGHYAEMFTLQAQAFNDPPAGNVQAE